MAELKIRKIREGTMELLNQQAKEKGFTSREEYLREVIEKLVQEEYQFESDVRYQLMIQQYQEFTTWAVEEIAKAVVAILTEKPH